MDTCKNAALALLFCCTSATAFAAQEPPEAPRLGGFLKQLDGFDQPSALAIDKDDNVYVVDTWARSLAIYDKSGELAVRCSGEVPPNLKLNEPRGIAVGADGTIYLSDGKRVVGFGWDAERKRHTGLRTAITYALVEPLGIAVDAEHLYVVDAAQNLVLLFERRSSKFAGAIGGWGGGEGEFRRPVDVAVDEEGRIYVADQGNQRVQRFDAQGRFLGSFGGFGPHPGLLAAPSSIKYAGGKLYVADRDNHRVQVFDREGKPLYDWGVHALRPHEGQGRLHYPDGLAISQSGEFAAVCEGFEDRVQLFGPEDEASRVLRAQSERTSAVHYGGGLAVAGRLCVVLEPGAAAGVVLDVSGAEAIEISRFGRWGEKPGLLLEPAGVALDGKNERAFVCDRAARRLDVFSLQRPADAPLKYDLLLPRFVESLELPDPVAVALDGSGRAYVLGDGGTLLVLGNDLRARGSSLGAPKSPLAPAAIAVSADGARVVVADPSAHALHLCETRTKAWTTWTAPVPQAADERASRPSGVAIARDGSIWFTDEQRHEVVGLSPALERVATFGKQGLGRVEFFKPRGIAIDEQGQLYVLDWGNHRVQVLSPAGEFVRAFGSRLFTEPTRKKP